MSGKEIDLDIIITMRGFSFAPLLSADLTSKLVLIILLPCGSKQGLCVIPVLVTEDCGVLCRATLSWIKTK